MIYWDKQDLTYIPLILLGIVVITLILYFTLRHKDIKYKKIPLIVITSLMIISEIIKQITSIIEGYDLYRLPVHFCSLFLYCFPLVCFAKGGVLNFGKVVSFISSFLMLVLFLLAPSRIIGTNAIVRMFTSYNSFHSVIYHLLAILFLFVGLTLGFFTYRVKDVKHVIIMITLYAIIVIPLAHLLDQNYCNALSNSYDGFQHIIENNGYVVYYITMYTLGLVGGIIIFFGKYLFSYLYNRRKEKVSLKKQEEKPN